MNVSCRKTAKFMEKFRIGDLLFHICRFCVIMVFTQIKARRFGNDEHTEKTA